MKDKETRRCHGSRGPGRCGSGAGVSLASLSELKKRRRGARPPAIFVTPAAASYTGRRGYRGSEGKDDAEIFTVGGRVRG